MLTNLKQELLVMLIEECGEVIHAATKYLRHGADSTHPDGGPTNREQLEKEILDLVVIAGMAESEDLLKLNTDMVKSLEVVANKTKYMKFLND